MAFDRYIAPGDSITEGLSDKSLAGGHRGWADRVADALAKCNKDFRNANFSVKEHPFNCGDASSCASFVQCSPGMAQHSLN